MQSITTATPLEALGPVGLFGFWRELGRLNDPAELYQAPRPHTDTTVTDFKHEDGPGRRR